MCDLFTSEYRRQLTPKQTFRKELFNPLIKCKDLLYMKTFENLRLRFAPSPLAPIQTTYNQDYQSRIPIKDDKLKLKQYRHHVQENEALKIDPAKPGYTKYLDKSATSNRLDFVRYSPEQKDTNDNITFASWAKNEIKKCHVWLIKENLSNKIKESKFSKHLCGEFANLKKTVPYFGLTTETKSKYKVPDRRLDFAFNKSFIQNEFLF